MRCCATMGGGTALNLARELDAAGVLRELGIELIGANIEAIHVPRTASSSRRRSSRSGSRCRRRASSPRPTTSKACRCRQSCGPRSRSAATAAASPTRRAAAAAGGARDRGVADRPGARRGVGAWLGRVRARGRARPRRQRGDRLLDREPRPDGRPHRRLRHGRAADDALATRPTRSSATRRSPSSAPSASTRAARTSSSRATAMSGDIRVIEMNPASRARRRSRRKRRATRSRRSPRSSPSGTPSTRSRTT